jgi:serine/threonine protein kinase
MATSLASAQVVGGRFRLLREIGRGAAGAVWHVRNEATERDFAMKVLHPGTQADPRVLRRFVNEARAAGRLRHRNVVEVYDLGILEDGTPYQVMQLLEGESLGARLKRVGSLGVREALVIVRDVARGLAAAHARGIVHRDVKPENVFLSASDLQWVAKLLDFGVSKLEEGTCDPFATRQGAVLGSPAYMSPEQIESATKVDGRTDIWAAGVLLYRCLAGRVPFPQRTLRELAMAIATSEPTPLATIRTDVPPAVVAIVARCLAKDPSARFHSASALVDALTSALDGSDLAAPVAPRRARSIALSLGALLVMVSLSAAWAGARSESQVRAEAVSPPAVAAEVAFTPVLESLSAPSALPPRAPASRATAARARAPRPSHEGVVEPGF